MTIAYGKPLSTTVHAVLRVTVRGVTATEAKKKLPRMSPATVAANLSKLTMARLVRRDDGVYSITSKGHQMLVAMRKYIGALKAIKDAWGPA